MKKTKLRSRRRTALRRMLIVAAAYLVVTCVLGTGVLFPTQIIRENEERHGTGRTSMIAWDWEPEIHRTQMLYLTENEHVTFLIGSYLRKNRCMQVRSAYPLLEGTPKIFFITTDGSTTRKSGVWKSVWNTLQSVIMER